MPNTESPPASSIIRNASNCGRADQGPVTAAVILRGRLSTEVPTVLAIQAAVIPAEMVGAETAVAAAAVAETRATLRQPHPPDFLYLHVAVDAAHGLLDAPRAAVALDR